MRVPLLRRYLALRLLAAIGEHIGHAYRFHRGDTNTGNRFFDRHDTGTYHVALNRNLTPFGRALFLSRAFAPLVNILGAARDL